LSLKRALCRADLPRALDERSAELSQDMTTAANDANRRIAEHGDELMDGHYRFRAARTMASMSGADGAVRRRRLFFASSVVRRIPRHAPLFGEVRVTAALAVIGDAVFGVVGPRAQGGDLSSAPHNGSSPARTLTWP